MLKTRLIATELLKKRVEEKSKRPKTSQNNADITIIGNKLLGYQPSILVSSEGNLYMFNCASGTQRICFTSRVKLHKLENVFVTNRTWDNISGIFGLSLTLQDMGVPSMTVHSTAGIKGLFESIRNFTFFNTGMTLSTSEVEAYKDSGISIRPIVLDSEEKSCVLADSENLDGMGAKRTKLSSNLVSYLCNLPDLRGALDPEKCKKLKVPVGPLLGDLKSGLDVQLADGSVVRSQDVCSPTKRGDKFLILECPDTAHIKPMIENNELRKACHLRLDGDGQQIDFVIHLSPSDVVKNATYQDWLQNFPKTCKHFFTDNTDANVPNFIECYRFQYLLNHIDDKIFPLLYLPEKLGQKRELNLESSSQNHQLDSIENHDELEPNYRLIGDLDHLETSTMMNSLDRISLRPKKFLESLDSEITIDILLREAKLDPHYQGELEKLQKLQKSLPNAKDYEPELVFLGTGSALPSKLRNTSCILMNFKYPRDASVIFDCGEDSYNQLLRHYGPDEAARILKQLDFIYVSHHHVDHHIGLIDILRQRKKLTDRCITLLLPPSLDNFINYHNENFQDIRGSYKVYRSKHIKANPMWGSTSPETASIKQTIYDDLDGLLEQIDVVEVNHCSNSCAAVFHFNINHHAMKKFVVAYSGDARPSTYFSMIGKDCDLLIHEATFDDRSQSDAIMKKHSTTSEAIQMGRDMNAKFTILTHFSQRNPKIPYFTDKFDDKVGFAFDNLTLKCPTHFGRLPIMKPILMLLFKKWVEQTDLIYLKHTLRSKAIEQILEAGSSN